MWVYPGIFYIYLKPSIIGVSFGIAKISTTRNIKEFIHFQPSKLWVGGSIPSGQANVHGLYSRFSLYLEIN